MSVSCLKNILGEDLIGEVSTTMSGEYIIEKPFLVMMIPSPNSPGSFGVGLIPYLQYADPHKFTFPGSAIVMQYEPSLELANQYRTLSGSSIVIARPELKLV